MAIECDDCFRLCYCKDCFASVIVDDLCSECLKKFQKEYDIEERIK